MSRCLKLPSLSDEAIRHHLEWILASPSFQATPQQCAFLKYVVDQTLAGNAEHIKGYTVATEVFGRRPDFNQSLDPIVSIQAAGLRRALQTYYKSAGRNDPIRIVIPRGTYVPSFERRPFKRMSDAKIVSANIDINRQSFWPSVLVQPLQNISGDPEYDFWGIGLASEIALELSRYPDILVMSTSTDNPHTNADPRNVQFIINGNVLSDENHIKITIRLLETQTGRQIWCDSHRSSIEAARPIQFQEDIARGVAAKVASEGGLIAKTMASGLKRHVSKQLEVYYAVLRYYDYLMSYRSEDLSRALTALEKATTIDPQCGQAWTMRARLLAYVYALGVPGYDSPLDKAFEFARNGIRLSPNDQRAHTIMAYVYLFGNEREAGLAEVEKALALGSRSLFMLDVLGYLMTLFGNWEQGPALIDKAIRSNPFYENDVHYALWVDWLRQGDYARAGQETLKLNRPALFWDHLARASTLGLLGDIEGGRRSAAQLLRRRPDFHADGRMLIQHFIKFEGIVDQIIEGLAAVDIAI